MKARQEREALELADELGLDLVAVCPTVTVGGPDYRLLPSNAIIVNYLNDPVLLHVPGRVQRGSRRGRRQRATSWWPSGASGGALPARF